MKVKLFGKTIFEFAKDKKNLLYGEAVRKLEESEYLPDFRSLYLNNSSFDYVSLTSTALTIKGGSKKSKKLKKAKKRFTPKEVYLLKTLNDDDFELNCNEDYIDEQLELFRDKLSLLNTKTDMRNGVVEVSSVIARIGNRKKYDKFKDFYEEYPYTTNSKITKVLKVHKNLKMDKVAQFVADMPKEAIKAMKDYGSKTMSLCKKKPIFYIIADKKDFEKTDKRRDPILLAQSPFGHVWQIIGAWDEEMMFLEEL